MGAGSGPCARGALRGLRGRALLLGVPPQEAAGRQRPALRACSRLPQGRRGAGRVLLPTGTARLRPRSGAGGDGSRRICWGRCGWGAPARDKRALGFAAVGPALPISPAPPHLLVIYLFISSLNAVGPLLLVFLFKSLFSLRSHPL